VVGAVGAATRMAVRVAAVGTLIAATWDDDDPVGHDPLISR
jgi:hypothetical protein